MEDQLILKSLLKSGFNTHVCARVCACVLREADFHPGLMDGVSVQEPDLSKEAESRLIGPSNISH